MKKSGILLVNLGTPADDSPAAVRQFLKKFLSDRRVIKTNPILWQIILRTMILPNRPKKSAKLYEQIMTADGFPLLNYTLAQQQNLQELLPDYQVAVGMSYSDPSIEQALDDLLAQGVNDLTVVPMYPQYSGTTVGSVFDSVVNYFRRHDAIVDLKFIRSYYDQPAYINFFAAKIKTALGQQSFDAIVFSYHGIPVSYVTDGDHYPDECTTTTKLIMAQVATKLPYYQTYQSKFGPAAWLTPATDATLKELPKQGIKKILIVAPGFVTDCLETIVELEDENKGYFMANGGEHFTYLAPFNDDPDFAQVIKDTLMI
ncbi:ferrochelatase [Lapidilactobacillus wuchangensis]|uniref:ferrochelatase n=1 Tax=Lapidilactobacillus wuchangensis TaxID=2486001 RepID=UPI000F774F2A|nr:ferrochelatase [Lapidilactobacillus wuchangensis]